MTNLAGKAKWTKKYHTMIMQGQMPENSVHTDNAKSWGKT